MKVLGLVPARGGSKGIPRKNLRPLAGKPLLQHTAEAALRATRLSRVILSTDDPQIAEVGRRCGLDVPFLRPAELARDDTPTLPVVQHAVRFVEAAGERFDAVCILQPTAPLRRTEFIDGCIEALEQSDADAIVTIMAVPEVYNPHWVYFAAADGRLQLSTGEPVPIPRRQDLPPAYHREGSVYVTRRHVLMDQNSVYGTRLIGYPIEPGDTIDINEPEDLVRAEAVLHTRSQPKLRHAHRL